MKWDYDIQTLRELVADGRLVQGDVVEALRAIAENLERIAENLEPSVMLRRRAIELLEGEELEAAARAAGLID